MYCLACLSSLEAENTLCPGSISELSSCPGSVLPSNTFVSCSGFLSFISAGRKPHTCFPIYTLHVQPCFATSFQSWGMCRVPLLLDYGHPATRSSPSSVPGVEGPASLCRSVGPSQESWTRNPGESTMFALAQEMLGCVTPVTPERLSWQ